MLKRPCENCPFKKDTLKGWLGQKRAEEISDSLSEHSFSCHKTLSNKNGEKFCAGALLVSENEENLGGRRIGKMIQMGGRLGLYKKIQ